MGQYLRKDAMEIKPEFFRTIKSYSAKLALSDLSAGIIVGIVALPLAIAFAIASGVPPEAGLITAVIAGFLVSFLGGSRVQIAGPSGALIVVIYGVAAQHGLDGVVLASMMAGIMLVAMGLLKAGSIIQFTPYPIVVGFTSGIALIIFTSQIRAIMGLSAYEMPNGIIQQWAFYYRKLPLVDVYSIIIGVMSIAITILWPFVSRKIPGSLLAIIASTLLVGLLGLPVPTIGSIYGEIGAHLHGPEIPYFNFELLKQLLVPAFTIAILCSIETLLSAMVADGVTGYRHKPNMELMANGIANMVAPLFGGMAASGALAKTMTNVRNGGKTPVAGMVHAMVLFALIMLFSKLVGVIPLASLGGVLVVVAYNMSEWRSFRGVLRSTPGEVAVLLTTFLLTVFIGLNVALPFGIILALVLFVRRVMETTDIQVLRNEVEDELSHISDDNETIEIPKGVEVFQIKGPFFFGIANKFDEAEREIRERPKVRIIRMRRVPFIDSTGIRNLRSFIRRSRKHRTHIILSGVLPNVQEIMKTDGLYDEIGSENICETIQCAIIRAKKIVNNQKSL